MPLPLASSEMRLVPATPVAVQAAVRSTLAMGIGTADHER